MSGAAGTLAGLPEKSRDPFSVCWDVRTLALPPVLPLQPYAAVQVFLFALLPQKTPGKPAVRVSVCWDVQPLALLPALLPQLCAPVWPLLPPLQLRLQLSGTPVYGGHIRLLLCWQWRPVPCQASQWPIGLHGRNQYSGSHWERIPLNRYRSTGRRLRQRSRSSSSRPGRGLHRRCERSPDRCLRGFRPPGCGPCHIRP